MPFSELDDNGRNFIISLHRLTKGDPAAQVSLYDIGTELGLDRPTASRLAEDLMGWEMVELRTLSGGISISATAVQELEDLGFGESAADSNAVHLGDEPLISEDVRQAVVGITSDLKQKAGGFGLNFDALAELMADLKTVDAQLESSRPKTDIVRACFRSLKNALSSAGATESADRIAGLLKE